MRLFLAVDLDDEAREALLAEQTRVSRAVGRSSLKLVKPDQLHITLVFLGEVPPERVGAVRTAIEAPLDGRRFDVVLDELGTFPDRGAPRVLWIAASGGARELVAVQRQIAARIDALGIAIDRRPFHPHLTIGRWRDSRPRDRRAVLDLPPPRAGIRVHVTGVTLYESRLSPAGPTYAPLARATLE